MASLLETLNKIHGANGEKPRTPTPLQIQRYIAEQQANVTYEESPGLPKKKKKNKEK